ncbi:Sugar transporter SWEET1, partial [Fragariocoptes setiger]
EAKRPIVFYTSISSEARAAAKRQRELNRSAVRAHTGLALTRPIIEAYTSMELVDFVAVLAIVCTYASFLSGAQVCLKVYRQRSASSYSALPFFAGWLCTALWLRYALLINESTMISVNVVGIICQTIYIGFFVVYTHRRPLLTKLIMALLMIVAVLIYSIDSSFDPVLVNGSLASMATLIACASPLASVQEVIRTKSATVLPFPIIASSFVVSSLWLTYGFLISDWFIKFTNAVASCISGSQLLLFAIYPSKSDIPYSKVKTNDMFDFTSVSTFEDSFKIEYNQISPSSSVILLLLTLVIPSIK